MYIHDNSRIGFGRCRLRCLCAEGKIDSVYSVTDSWDDISQTLFVNSPVPESFYEFISQKLFFEDMPHPPQTKWVLIWPGCLTKAIDPPQRVAQGWWKKYFLAKSILVWIFFSYPALLSNLYYVIKQMGLCISLPF